MKIHTKSVSKAFLWAFRAAVHGKTVTLVRRMGVWIITVK